MTEEEMFTFVPHPPCEADMKIICRRPSPLSIRLWRMERGESRLMKTISEFVEGGEEKKRQNPGRFCLYIKSDFKLFSRFLFLILILFLNLFLHFILSHHIRFGSFLRFTAACFPGSFLGFAFALAVNFIEIN
jgi:hypothetical protein